ncbi:hypothetical protein D3C78_1710310 [compost metagenome]
MANLTGKRPLLTLSHSASDVVSHQILNYRLRNHPLVVTQSPIMCQLLLIRGSAMNRLIHVLNKSIPLQITNLSLKLGGCQQGSDQLRITQGAGGQGFAPGIQ